MKITNIIAFIALLCSTCACDESLDLLPEDRLSAETYFKNENEIRLFTNSFYASLPSVDDLCKESFDLVVVSQLDPIVSGQRIVPDKGGDWTFSDLRKINFYLSNSKNCTNELVRQKYDALARFFRAYFYFEKVKRFGDVPWYDKVLDSNDEDLYKPRDSREFVLQKVMEDLDFAIQYLSSEKNLYRITKWTALALKSRVALFEGTFRKYHGIQGAEEYLNLCVEASEEFMKSDYTLYSKGNKPYFDLFSSFEKRPEEYILARDFDQSLSLAHDVQVYENSTTLGRPGLTKRIVNSYLMKDGSRFTDIPNFETLQFFDECQNRDPRLSQTIRTPGYVQLGGTAKVSPNLSFTLTGYHLIKFSNHKDYDQVRGYNDIPYFRTAEVYLNLAESKAELGSLTQNDLDRTINQIRARAGITTMLVLDEANANPDPYLLSVHGGYPNVTQSVNTGVILEIRRERTIELIMEGFRFWDLLRWKEGKSMEQSFQGIFIPGPGAYDLDKNGKNDVCFYLDDKPSVFVPLFLKIGQDVILTEGDRGNIICHNVNERIWREDRDYLFPIPIQERALTGGKLSQNPGWIDGLQFE